MTVLFKCRLVLFSVVLEGLVTRWEYLHFTVSKRMYQIQEGCIKIHHMIQQQINIMTSPEYIKWF